MDNKVMATAAVATDAAIIVSPSGDASGEQDSSNIAAAMATAQSAGGIVELTEGRFVLNRSIRLASNIWLRGRGMGRSTVTLVDGVPHGSTSDNVIFCSPTTTSGDLHDFRISDLTVDANRDGLDVVQNGYALGSLVPAIPYTVSSGANDTITYSVDGGPSRTARIAAGRYATLSALVGALQAALNVAGARTTAFALRGAVGIKSDNGVPPTTITALGGNGLAGLMGAPVSHPGLADSGGNGICIRGSSAGLRCRDFAIERVECINASYHGMAIYDGASNFEVRACRFHDNGYRGFHCHAVSSAGGAPSARFSVAGNRVYRNGQGLFNAGNSGLFVVFANTHDVSVTDNIISDEPTLALEIDGSDAGATQATDNSIVTGNRVANCGTGAVFTALSQFGPTGVLFANNILRGCGTNVCIGSAAPSTLTITAAGHNHQLLVTLDDATRTVTLPAGAPYASYAALAAALQTAVNNTFARDGAAVTVTALLRPANVLQVVPTFVNGGGAAAFAIGPVAGNSGFSVLFGNAAVQYGGRSSSASGHGIMMSGAASGGSDIVISGNRITGCSGWGIASTAAATGWRNITFSSNIVSGNGLDPGRNTGGIFTTSSFAYSTIVGNVVVGNNALAATGRQGHIGGTAMTVIGNVFDTGPGAPGNFPALDLSTTASVCMGNVLNRGNGTGNQGVSSGSGNVVCNNMLGASGAGTFQFLNQAELGAALGFGGTGSAAASLTANAPGPSPLAVVEWEAVKRSNGAIGFRPVFG